MGDIAIVSVTFASVAAGLSAVGLFVRDLLAHPAEGARPRLALAPQEPEGAIDGAFFRLVEESGTPWDVNTALAVVVGGAIVGLAIPLVLLENLLVAAGGMVLGTALPILHLAVIRYFRVRNMRRHLPQALQAVGDAVRSGQNLSEACQLVSQEIKGPLGQEFGFAHSQLQLGHSPLAVMHRMAGRIPLAEFRVFATAVVVHRRAGGNLSLLTERMAKAAHDRHDIRSHMLAVTAGARLSAVGMVLAGIVALIMLGWWEPDYVETFLQHPKGPWLLGASVLLQLTGGLWVWQILKPVS